MIVDCAFCDEFQQPVEQTRIVKRSAQRVALPTIGSFTEGYLLYMPAEHTLSFSDLSTDEKETTEADLEQLRTSLTELYGPVILAEHGPRFCDPGAGCCDHAHMHLIPVPEIAPVLEAYERVGGPGLERATLAECLAEVEESYVYLSPEPGRHLLWPAAPFPRQWVRRVCSDLHGRGEQWDWRDHPFAEERGNTYDLLLKELIDMEFHG